MRTHSKETINYHTGGDVGGSAGALHEHDLNQGDIPDIKPPGLAWVDTHGGHHLGQSPPHMLAPPQVFILSGKDFSNNILTFFRLLLLQLC